MNEQKKIELQRSLYIKIGIWIVLSALILAGLVVLVGVAFEKIGGEEAVINEVVFLPQQHDNSRGTSTLSYSMAARYSDGSIGNLPEIDSISNNGELIFSGDPVDLEMKSKTQSRGNAEEGDTWDLSYKGSPEDFKVPVGGVYQFEVWGAQGGPTQGKGGYSKGKLEVNANDTIGVYVGGKGQNRGGGWNGGGTAGTGTAYGSSYGGGGGTDMRIGGKALKDRVIVAGGGGGQAASGRYGASGGNGGGASGARGGLWCCGNPGDGGTQNAGGRGGQRRVNACRNGGNASLGQGGNGANACWYQGGGGGGGGFYGGGGGSDGCGGAAGGGGSGYVGGVSEGTTSSGVQSGHGKAKITLIEKKGASAEYGFKYKDGTGISKEFSYTGGRQSWVVPNGTNFIEVDAYGAQGGSGGKGGQVHARLAVTPGETLYIYVGGKGADQHGNRSPGWNGGGQGGYSNYSRHGGGGGGGTDIRRNGTGWGNRILVAGGGGGKGGGNYPGGGGGGGGGYYGGGGGGSGISQCCGDYGSRNGYNGTQGSGGRGGDAQDRCRSSYNSSSGNGGVGGGTTGGTGGRSNGGYGGSGGTQNGGGRGGSRGGGCNANYINGGGGGGGSSYVKSGSQDVKHTQGVQNGHGKLKITTPPEILGVYYKEPFSEEFKESEFGPAWSIYSSDGENARNERINTEPGMNEKAKYTFTNCNATQYYGPTQGQINSSYANTNLAGKVTIKRRGIQEWVIPETGTYTIQTLGARAGYGTRYNDNGGRGASMKGDFKLNKGDRLKILVGQKGGNGYGAGGGGGGSYVVMSNNSPLVIAGGGGGGQYGSSVQNYQHGTTSKNGQSTNRRSGGSNGYGGQGDRGGGAGGGGGLLGDGGRGSYGNPGRAFVNGGEGGRHNYYGFSGFGGGGGTHGNSGGGGGGGGYSGGAGGYHNATWGNGGGGGSYNNGSNKSDSSGVNNDHGKVEIILYEEIPDPGFDAYDPEERGTTCWVMDTGAGRGPNLNQLLLHIGLDAGEDSVTSLKLSFAAEIYGNTEVMPANFGKNMLPHNYDGIAVSIDNENWYRVWQPNAAAKWSLVENLDLLNILPNGSVDAKEDLYIRFQQYGSGKIKNEGILWDEIYLESSSKVQYIFTVPQLNIDFEYEPDPFTIFAETQGDPDSAAVKVTISGSTGFDWNKGGGGSRAEPIVYNFSNCGATQYRGPTQAQVNSAYSNTNLAGQITINRRGIQEWKVPKSGTYTMETWGAKGGDQKGGKGARMKGDFELTEGETIKILIGQKGGAYRSGGGGGGTFITKNDNTPLIIAGGGGGQYYYNSNHPANIHGTTSKNGQNNNWGRAGGRNGGGGSGESRSGASGGGGLSGDGSRGSYGYGGRSFTNGGEGQRGSSYSQAFGGFGGGGSTHGNTGGGGGGGGYSGGAGGYHDHHRGNGGGGGSYNDGENPNNSNGINSDHGKAQITFIGGGDPVAQEVRFTYEKADGLIIDGDENIDKVTWSSADENEDDFVADGDEFEIEFDLSSPDGFYGSIGPVTVTYYSWDEDEIDHVVDIPNLRIQAFSFAKLEGDVIANNGAKQNDPGSLLTMESYDDQDPPGVMPAQEFNNWRAVNLGDSVEFVNVIDNRTGQPYPHKKMIRVTGGKPGDKGTVFVTHVASGEEDGYSVTLSSGPVSQGTIYKEDSYVVGEPGIITVSLEDAYGNACFDWRDRMYVKVTAGKVDFEDKLEEDGRGKYYTYTDKDKGSHDFIITPLTYHGIGPTTIVFETVAVPIGEPANINVVAGPVNSLHVEYDPPKMPGWEGSYHAGDELYLIVYGTDKMGNPSSTYDAPIIVTHDFVTENAEEVPEPWQSSGGSVILNMVDGVATNYPGQPLKFFIAGEVNITFRSKIDLQGIKGFTKTVTVHPTFLDHLEALPGGPDADPVTVDVKVGATQHFSVKGFDEFGNDVVIESTSWRADTNIKANESPNILNDGEFKAIAYFGPEDEGVVYDSISGYSMRIGKIAVTAVCPRDLREVKRDIAVRVLNDKDVWLESNRIEPNHILAGHEMNFKANIFYDMPVTNQGKDSQYSALGDLFEVSVKVSLVDKDGKELTELARKPVRFDDLNTHPKGIEDVNIKIPWESFNEHIKIWRPGNDDSKNYILIEVDEVIGGTDMKLFEKTNDNNRVTVELYAVRARPAGVTPSFAPSVAAMGIALLGLAVGSTFYSGKKRKKGYRRDREAVSPVIAIILMVAITIVLAGVLWLWVSGLVDTGKEDGVGGIVNVEPDTRTVNKDYVLKVETLTAENDLSVEDLRFTLFSSDRRDMSNGQHRVSNVYGKPIDDQTFISFRDGDHDGKLSIGDRFVIKSFEHVDDDGSTDSPGFAEPGFFFELRAGKRLLFEEQIK